MIFDWIVRKLHWLCRVPLLPHLFDAALLLWTTVVRPDAIRAREALETESVRSFGLTLGLHRLGGTGFFLNRTEIAHLHGNGLLDVFVGDEARDLLVVSGRARPHHLFPESGWISFWLTNHAAAEAALDLLRLAVGRRCPIDIPA